MHRIKHFSEEVSADCGVVQREDLPPHTVAGIVAAAQCEPHLTDSDVAELERAIESGQLPVRDALIFDE